MNFKYYLNVESIHDVIAWAMLFDYEDESEYIISVYDDLIKYYGYVFENYRITYKDVDVFDIFDVVYRIHHDYASFLIDMEC